MMSSISLLLLAICVLSAQASWWSFWEDEGTTVKGKLLCKGKPVEGATIKLIDTDTLRGDDLMAQALTDKDGAYTVSGSSWDLLGDIDPVVEIEYNCDTTFKQCYRIKIPDEYVTEGKIPTKVFVATDIEFSSIKANC